MCYNRGRIKMKGKETMKNFLYVLMCAVLLSCTSCGSGSEENKYIQLEPTKPKAEAVITAVTSVTPSAKNAEKETTPPQKVCDATVVPSDGGEYATVYYGKSESSPEFGKAERGQLVEVYERGEEWSKILIDSKYVYISTANLEESDK